MATRPYFNSGITWVIVVVLEKSTLGDSFTLVAVVAPIVGVVLLLVSITLVYFLTKRLASARIFSESKVKFPKLNLILVFLGLPSP